MLIPMSEISAVIRKALMGDRDGVKSHVVMVTQSFSPDFCSPPPSPWILKEFSRRKKMKVANGILDIIKSYFRLAPELKSFPLLSHDTIPKPPISP